MSDNFITPARLEAMGELQRRMHALDAATKRLQASNAQFKADRLKREAKEAVAAIPSHMEALAALEGAQKSAYFLKHERAIRGEQFAASQTSGVTTLDAETGAVITTFTQR